MKATEYRNIILFFFPIILECIGDDFPMEQKLWLHMTYMIRACVISNEEFRNVKDKDVESASKKSYSLYKKLYGQLNCTYSIHVLFSHILQIRGNRPLTFKSAFKFESFFSEMRHLFHPGSVSPLKQILQNCFVKRMLEFHHCEKETFFQAKKKPKPGRKFNPGRESNHLIYIFTEDQTYKMYSIEEIIDKDNFRCFTQGKFPLNLPLTPEYNWSNVGVFKTGPICEEYVIINRKNISGKVIQVNNCAAS